MNLVRANRSLAVLAVLLAIPVVWTWNSGQLEFQEPGGATPLFDGFTPASVQSIRIEQPAALLQVGEPDGPTDFSERAVLELRRTREDDWEIANGRFAGLPVLEQRVQLKIFEPLAEVPGGETSLVLEGATDEELAQNLLSDELGTRVTCSDAQGRVLADLLLGRRTNRSSVAGDEVRGFFVREAGTRDVRLYEREGLLIHAVPSDWLEQRAFPCDLDEVVGFELRNASGVLELRRPVDRATDWRVLRSEIPGAEERRPDLIGSEVTGFLVRALRAQVQDVNAAIPFEPGPQEDYLRRQGLLAPTARLALSLADGRSLALTIGADVASQNTTHAWIEGWSFTIQVNRDTVAMPLRTDLKKFFVPR